MLQKIKHYWLKFGNFIGMVNARIILTLLYFVIIPVFAIPYKVVLFFLQRKKTSNWDTYNRKPDITEQF